MIGDTTIPIEIRKDWVWEQIAQTHPEFRRENFPVDDPYLLYDIVVRNCYQYTPLAGHKVMDVGANIGIFTMLCALNGCDVTAYEPNPAAFAVLSRTMLRNETEHVAAWPWAIWANTGTCPYHPSSTPPDGNLQTWESFNGAVLTPGADPEETAVCISFESALANLQWDCVKMDIEGAEFPVLMNTPDAALRHIKYLTLELHNSHASKEVHDALIERLQRVFTIDGVREGDPRFTGENRYISVFARRL